MCKNGVYYNNEDLDTFFLTFVTNTQAPRTPASCKLRRSLANNLVPPTAGTCIVTFLPLRTLQTTNINVLRCTATVLNYLTYYLTWALSWPTECVALAVVIMESAPIRILTRKVGWPTSKVSFSTGSYTTGV